MNRTVLIVDDSLTVRMDLADAFEAAGFRVEACGSAEEARESARRTTPDAVVLDVRLPDADGVELLQEFRQSEWGAKAIIVMLSSEADVRDRIRGIRTGADEYVGKPYDISYLIAKVHEFLARNTAGDNSTILVIDDSETFRSALRSALHEAGYAVLAAQSGEEGLRLAGAGRPGAIVVDGELPGIDGATVIRHIRLDPVLRDVPCLLLTGSDRADAELQALDAGADTFIRKSEDLDVILAKITAVLRRTTTRPPADAGMASALGPKKILAVDDSITYLQELTAALTGDGYDVVAARSGEEALELLAVQPVDCILLDLVMPGLGGQETCRRIKSAPGVHDIPVIILTSFENRESMIQGLGAGADDYIQKSSDLEVVKARIRAQMRRKQFEDDHRRTREDLLRKGMEAAEARAAKELAETRAALVDELERKNMELEAFSYSVSHDLRAPLRAVDGFSQTLLEDFGDTLDPRAQDYLKRVRTAAQRMGELIDDLLELARVGRSQLTRTHFDLGHLAREVVRDLRERDAGRQVEVSIETGLDVHADPKLIRIVLENLIGNSWKFTGNTPNPSIQCGREQHSTGAAYFVRDNGAGFNMTYVDKLFRPFQRLHTTQEFPGTGIGLATVYRIIDRHGGKAWAESVLGSGTTIYFTLPVPTSRPLRPTS